jgi:hypothetical protein
MAHSAIITTDASWQQSFDGNTWSAAILENPTSPYLGLGTPQYFLWNIESPTVTTYFRQQFTMASLPTYAVFHWNFYDRGNTLFNNVQVMNLDTYSSRQSGGFEIEKLVSIGLNTIFVTIPPSPSGAVKFQTWTELNVDPVDPINHVPEPETLTLIAIGLLSVAACRRNTKQI